ncbi:uncharacterized protein LOC142566740 [Dermacentor variabilis]|uniref:uncharacterized protein LOC142566740 n=1 Tax=Dermacentor variabilis TaxID=34621 RepID=UPI003F5C8077
MSQRGALQHMPDGGLSSSTHARSPSEQLLRGEAGSLQGGPQQGPSSQKFAHATIVSRGDGLVITPIAIVSAARNAGTLLGTTHCGISEDLRMQARFSFIDC